MSKKRIKGFTRTKKGDTGFTELVQKYKYPKSDELCFIYNYFQSAILDLQLFLNSVDNKNLLDIEDYEIINTIKNPILGDTTAILWTKVQEDNLKDKLDKINIDSRKLIEDRNKYLNSLFPDADEFIVFTATEVCELGKLWLKIRNIEHLVWKCIHRFHSYDIRSIPKDVRGLGSFYNLMGDYFFNVCRYIQKYKLNKEEEYWKHESFTPEEKLVNELNKINPNINWVVYATGNYAAWVLTEENMKGFHLANVSKEDIITFVKNYNE